MVVMGPGDEMTVEFSVPGEPVPEGWVRDFVLYNVGWDKDADLSTVYGQSSEPYPTRAMSQYPQDVAQEQELSAEYQRWLREYQTREYRRFEFRDVVRRQAKGIVAPGHRVNAFCRIQPLECSCSDFRHKLHAMATCLFHSPKDHPAMPPFPPFSLSISLQQLRSFSSRLAAGSSCILCCVPFSGSVCTSSDHRSHDRRGNQPRKCLPRFQ
jgi:hypothetical protein